MRKLFWLLVLPACAEPREDHYVDHAPSVVRSGMAIDDVGGCDTSVVNALTRQLVVELNCIAPNTMVDFSGPDVSQTAAVQPYLASSAAEALHAATASMGEVIHVSSAYRSVAQQYLLYKWWQAGSCGIQVAATPGSSNHQSGRAIDISDHDHWNAALTAQGWTWLGSSDVVHFDFLTAPDIRSSSVLAFQRLWNKNNTVLLDEDGQWGPHTEAAMKAAPAEGFPIWGCSSGTVGTTGSSGSSTGSSTGSGSSSISGSTTSSSSSSSSTGGTGSAGSDGGPTVDAGSLDDGYLGGGGGCQAADATSLLAWLGLGLLARRRG